MKDATERTTVSMALNLISEKERYEVYKTKIGLLAKREIMILAGRRNADGTEFTKVDLSVLKGQAIYEAMVELLEKQRQHRSAQMDLDPELIMKGLYAVFIPWRLFIVLYARDAATLVRKFRGRFWDIITEKGLTSYLDGSRDNRRVREDWIKFLV